MTARKKSALNKLSVLTAGGALLFGITLRTSSYSQSIDKPDTPLKVALVLDCITQPRFQADMPNFGLERMLPLAGGHLVYGRILLPTQKDRNLFQAAENAHRDFVMGFIRCAHVPGNALKNPTMSHSGSPSLKRPKLSKEKPRPASLPPNSDFVGPVLRVSPVCNRLRHLYAAEPRTASAEETNLYKEMGKAAQQALPKLMKGQGAEQDAGDWLIVTRPVCALKTACLKCHEGAKLGDTLGVMAYVVSKKTFAAVLPTSRDKPAGALRGGF